MDDIIYTYSICAIFNPDIRNPESQIWKDIKLCYDGKNDGGIGKTRYKQINDIDLKGIMELERVVPAFFQKDLNFVTELVQSQKTSRMKQEKRGCPLQNFILQKLFILQDLIGKQFLLMVSVL